MYRTRENAGRAWGDKLKINVNMLALTAFVKSSGRVFELISIVGLWIHVSRLSQALGIMVDGDRSYSRAIGVLSELHPAEG